MITKLKDIALRVRSSIGIEICLLPDDKIIINTVTLNVHKNKVIKQYESRPLPGFEHLPPKTNNQLAASLTITGKGILLKRVPIEEIPTNPIEFVLPTANPDDFYFEIHRLQEYAS